VTCDPRRPFAEAIAVDRGRVRAVGGAQAVRRAAGAGAARVDCRGRAVLPGIVDPHLHLFGLAARDLHLDCSTFGDVAALLAAVAERAPTLDAGVWLRADGLDETRLDRLPTADELERAAPGNPVRLRHRSRHASVLSRSALARLPAGCAGVERRRGRPTGLVYGVEALVSRIVGPPPARALEDGLARASRDLAALGVTTVADATPRRGNALAPLRRAIAAGGVVQRVYAMRPWNVAAWRAVGRLAPGPVKILVDETPQGLRPDRRTITRRIAVAARRGDQVAVHCVGVATLATVLDAFAALPAQWRRGRRHRLEHVAECPPSLVARIAALGLVVVTNPAFVYWRGDVYRDETHGPARAWLYRMRTLGEAGVALAAASDAPVVAPSPWVGMAAARARRTRRGRVFGAGERLDACAALDLFTRGAAWSLHADALGALRPGAPADLVVVEPDPLRASPAELAAAQVRLTMIGGMVVWGS